LVSWEVQSRGFLAVTNHGHDRAVGSFEQIGLVACWDDRRGQSKSVSLFSSRTCETTRNVVEVVVFFAEEFQIRKPLHPLRRRRRRRRLKGKKASKNARRAFCKKRARSQPRAQMRSAFRAKAHFSRSNPPSTPRDTPRVRSFVGTKSRRRTQN
jgi:hypothetical protein